MRKKRGNGEMRDLYRERLAQKDALVEAETPVGRIRARAVADEYPGISLFFVPMGGNDEIKLVEMNFFPNAELLGAQVYGDLSKDGATAFVNFSGLEEFRCIPKEEKEGLEK